ncbi:MAG: hypothetical protein AAGC57_13875 [Pseudomonadota bacterium]
MTDLPIIPERDHRDDGLLGHAMRNVRAAGHVMDTVLGGMGVAGHLVRPMLAPADRLAEAWLRRVGDPYLDDILAIRRSLARPGPVAFSLSYEFGCTARVFSGAPRVLMRTLDWPFRGLGELVELVHLSGPAGPWSTATWPGVVGVIQGMAPGRFAAALNQAPERRTGFGRPIDWLAGKRRFWRAQGLPPTHLLRRVFETCPDFPSALAMLRDAPVAAPGIFTLAGLSDGEAVSIERTENAGHIRRAPSATNGFSEAGGSWRARGIDSAGRLAQVEAMDAPPGHTALAPPMLNALTRLAVTASADGRLSLTGFDGLTPVTQTCRHDVSARDSAPGA